MTYITVIMLQGGILQSVHLSHGEDENKVISTAKDLFTKLCYKHLPDWQKMSKEEKGNALDEGFCSTLDGEVQILLVRPFLEGN